MLPGDGEVGRTEPDGAFKLMVPLFSELLVGVDGVVVVALDVFVSGDILVGTGGIVGGVVEIVNGVVVAGIVNGVGLVEVVVELVVSVEVVLVSALGETFVSVGVVRLDTTM